MAHTPVALIDGTKFLATCSVNAIAKRLCMGTRGHLAQLLCSPSQPQRPQPRANQQLFNLIDWPLYETLTS